jgi:hypothetical protein
MSLVRRLEKARSIEYIFDTVLPAFPQAAE